MVACTASIPARTTLLLTCHPCTLAKCGGMLRPDLAVEKGGNKKYLNKRKIVRTRSLYFQLPWVNSVRAIFPHLAKSFMFSF
jgi:hypothetical protein